MLKNTFNLLTRSVRNVPSKQWLPYQQKQINITRQIKYNFCMDDPNQIIWLHQNLAKIKVEDGSNILKNKYVVNANVEAGGKVVIELKLDQHYRKIKKLIENQLQGLEWIKDLEIKMATKPTETKVQSKGGLENVKHIVAVSSCKGGVGKSTVSINLAASLMKKGFKVGVYDADIYGPSIPTLIAQEQRTLHSAEDDSKAIMPVEYENMLTMSYGYAAQQQKAVMRGPMVSQIVSQLIRQTRWGDLDYLIVDMPPGTGDIQLTLGQELNITAAVVVSTPQKIAFIDVVKGIEMFDALKVPTIAVVENMAEFTCTNCGTPHKIFGHGYIDNMINHFGIKKSVTIPLFSDIAKYSDHGSPVCLTLPAEHTITKLYAKLADNVHEEIQALQTGNRQPPIVRYQTGKNRAVIVEQQDGQIKKLEPANLRYWCNCALCVDEFTGQRVLQREKVDDDVYPIKIEAKGNYAVAIIWSDGHKSSIYTYDRLLEEIQGFE